METTRDFEKADGLEAVIRLMRICKEIENPEADPDSLRIQAGEQLAFCQKLQDEMIDGGHINIVHLDCHTKHDPLGFFEQKLEIIQFKKAASTPQVREAGRKLREHAAEIGA